MGVDPSHGGVDKLKRKIEIIMQGFREALILTGERAVAYARQNGTYTDRTGNLRSSVGYVVVDRGTVIKRGGFQGQGTEGKQEGEAEINKLASQYPNDMVLIVVAGMNYATFVEKKGYDVISGSEIESKKIAKKLISEVLK